MKGEISNVSVTQHGHDRFTLGWHAYGCKFHVWMNGKGVMDRHRSTRKATLYKNPVPKRGEPGHFSTRRLDADGKGNAAMIARVRGSILLHDCIARASAHYQAAERSEIDKAKAHRRIETIKCFALEMHRLISEATDEKSKALAARIEKAIAENQ